MDRHQAKGKRKEKIIYKKKQKKESKEREASLADCFLGAKTTCDSHRSAPAKQPPGCDATRCNAMQDGQLLLYIVVCLLLFFILFSISIPHHDK